nr:DUF3142 domain-containing protein [Acinetobacter brisouii]
MQGFFKTAWMILLSFASCSLANSHVEAQHYRQFWLWGNIQTRTYLSNATELYILQGEVKFLRSEQHSQLIPQGIGLRSFPHQQKVWLVFRTTSLNWQTDTTQQVIQRLQQWKNTGNQVIGLQIDFDSGTRNLGQYANFLVQLRQQLPKSYRLSITGLLDWTNHQDPLTLTKLQQSVDEIVLQSYQGRHTIENYTQYIQRLKTLPIPFKLGLVEHGTWQPPSGLESNPNFLGYVVFLLPKKFDK